jgi:hypothetical protein
MNPSETLSFTLAIRDDLHRRHPYLSPAQEEAVINHLRKFADVATQQENGDFNFLGESLSDAIDGVIGAGRGQAASPVAAVLPLSDEERAAKLGGYTLAEFKALPGDVRYRLSGEASGDPGLFWSGGAKPRAHGLTAEQVAKLTPEEKISLGNEAARGES